MSRRQFILIGPKGNFLIKQDVILDIKRNKSNLIDIIQSENITSKQVLLNPYPYVVKKHKPKLKDSLLQELLKVRSFHKFSNKSHLFADSGLEDLKAASYYFKNDTWMYVDLDVKYNKDQFVECLNDVKEKWLKEKLGKNTTMIIK